MRDPAPRAFGVSPGFTSRPSLSEGLPRTWSISQGEVSPGFTSRPSLSGAPHGGRWRLDQVECRRDSRPGLR